MTLEQQFGYDFIDGSLLKLALTHRSVSADDSSRKDNERLEFLGDAVLQLAITAYLYDTFPELHEGNLAKIRAGLVSRPVLADVARSIGLAEHIELTPAEDRTGGREKDSIMADALEAVIGAVFLDSGLGSASDLVLRLWGGRIDERAQRPGLKDYKTRLQEVLAKDGRYPDYQSDGSGPDHERTFVATVEVDGLVLGTGSGKSKKEAEQGAAEQALATLIEDSR
ncbi:MAG TPA: ribonuclease III [Acidimicrobiia bacterium]|nr:ribonuclease III [Acidimicrobiia bacterium]